MEWWAQMLPLDPFGNRPATIKYRGMERDIAAPSWDSSARGTDAERVMLVRPRKSRIYYLHRFLNYPIALSKDTLLKLGLWRSFRVGLSYLRSALLAIKNEQTLEQFFINRFGRELYATFFKSYTEKVWGVPCHRISAEWGAQRIKGVSVVSTLRHALRKMFRKDSGGVAQKETETSLIEQFLYPKFGPGQMWEEVARRVLEAGGEIHTNCRVERLVTDGWNVKAVEANTSVGVPM